MSNRPAPPPAPAGDPGDGAIDVAHPAGSGRAGEVFRVFLRLGLTSFGGPTAHLGYFREELVVRRRWLSESHYAELVALSQFIPGPASSQVGFGLGLQRAGFRGALAAFIAFTLPSALIMLLLALSATQFTGPIADGLITGLKVVAVAIVAQAVLGMARSLTPDLSRIGIAVLALAAALWLPGAWGQLLAIGIGAVAGLLWCRRAETGPAAPATALVSRSVGIWSLSLFVAIMLALPVLARLAPGGTLDLFAANFRAGALVFGGGHVVLPLLEGSMVAPGWVTSSDFLAGYGAAQALPGPLFSLAAYLGAISAVGPGGAVGALVALLGIFLPGFLLLIGVLPFWSALARRPSAQAAMRGVGAAVVGILAAALYSPVFVSAVTGPATLALALALACFALLVWAKLPPWLVVAAGAAGGVALALVPIH